jgi:hypothetical protein
MITETTVKVGAKLYEMRDIVRRMQGKRYAEAVRVTQEVIKRAAAQFDGNELKAAMWLAKRAHPEDAFAKMCIMAAWVESIEPSSGPEHG